jgi:O-succinylbenzoate synthase
MKIEALTLHHLSMPLVSPFETSFGRETDRQCILITLQADGLTGYGECVATREIRSKQNGKGKPDEGWE